MIISDFHYLTDSQSELLLEKIGSKVKYRLITLLMMDAGLRVSEAVSLKLENLRFREKIIRVRSLKKRTEHYRDIPMSARLMMTMGKYLNHYKGDKNNSQSWLFPSKKGHLKRIAVWRFYNRIAVKHPQLKHLHPHALRHTFATRLVNSDVNLLTAKELLGHGSVQTTEIYTHIPAQVLKNSIAAIEKKPSWLIRIYRKLTGHKRAHTIRLGNQHKSILVGREKELLQLHDLTEKKVNVLLKGPQGVGKSQILDNLQIQGRKIVRMDEIKSVKTALTNFAMHVLKNDKKELCEMLFNDTDVEAKLTKDSTKNLVDLLKRITEKDEYTLIVDDVTDITPTGVKVLEQMRNHFHIIAGARTVKLDKAGFLTNFQKIEIDNLSRPKALELIHRLSYDVIDAIEDYELYKNHIWEQTNGNPQYIYELIERYRKEEYIANETIREIRHNAANPEIDFTPIVLIALGSLIILRYLGREIGQDGYQLIGGVALVFALFARQLLRVFKRKFI
ncbi:MAG: site-specific integrase [Pseudomonadota bacterium]